MTTKSLQSLTHMKGYQYTYIAIKHGTHYEYDSCLLAMQAYKLPY